MAGKWLNRRRYFWKLIVSIGPFVLSVLGVYASTIYKNFPPVVILLLVFALLITVLIAIFRGALIVGLLIDPLNPVEKSFERLYAALTYNDPEPGEKYGTQVQEAIHKLMQSVSYQLGSVGAPGILMNEEIDDLITKFRDNVDKRLVPASRDGDLTPDTMRQLAKVLANPSVDGLRKLNTNVESTYEEGTKEGIDIPSRLSRFFSGNRGEITRSLIFGFGVTIFSSIGYAYLTQQDFVIFAKYNPAVILGGAFALTAGYLAYLKKG